MELHTKEYPLADNHSVVYIFNKEGTLQGYVQGTLKAWGAYIGRPGKYLGTFEDKDDAVGILVDLLQEE